MELSVVLPCYNHGEYLLEAIASVELCLEQNPDLAIEVIVVNDGSDQPDTIEILDSLRQDPFYIFLDRPNQGLANARNTGIAKASGKYILPLDADNKIRPEYIPRGLEILDQEPEVGVVYGNMEFFGEAIGRWELPEFDLFRLMLSNYIDACAIFRKSIWQECGGYDEQIPDRLGYEDWEFWLRVGQRGWKFHHINQVMYDYRVRSDSMVQACKTPENQKRLVHYITDKHRRLYEQYLPEVVADKEYNLFREMAKTQELRNQLTQIQENSQRERQRLEIALAGCRAEILDLQRQHVEEQIRVQDLTRRIHAMESSKFWQLRRWWFKLKRWLKISDQMA
ncbi:MAG: glycosyltransferase [Pseudanabaenaceae cyanobacterium bins.68]|nr:glycosyltransferase [Pseudanabaenaceae cyanobacterium bins.68]